MRGPRRFSLALLVAAILVPWLAADAGPKVEDDQLFKIYGEILTTVRENAVEPIATRKLVGASIHGMLSHLDPHSSYLEVDQYRDMQEKQKGSFFGLGIIVSKRFGKVTVISPIEGTPAYRLGIRPGDVISEIEGVPVGDEPIDQVVRKLKGQKDTQVRITIERPGFSEPIRLTITRAEIPSASVRYAFLAEPGLGYIRISDFTHTTGREVREAIEKLRAAGMMKLVVDLRDNPGGILEQSVQVADLFLREGELVVYTEGRAASSDQRYVAPGGGLWTEGPLVVLINKGSASASEIVTGALQDHDRALVIGTRSWGKGLVQSVFHLSSGDGLALTTARYMTPSGRSIQRDYSSLLEYQLGGDDGSKAEPEKEGPTYRTDAGRTVTGGGGILPDVVVPAREPSKLLVRLESRGSFFSFAVEYLAAHPDVKSNLVYDDALAAELGRFLASGANPLFKTGDEALAAIAAEKPEDADAIRRAARSQILAAKLGLEAGFRVSLEGDPAYQEALKRLPEAAVLARGRMGAKTDAASERGTTKPS